jgi:HSP20 family protein
MEPGSSGSYLLRRVDIIGRQEMGQKRPNPFRGFVDVMSEMNRMGEVGRGMYEPGHEDRERTQASAWVPNADVFARGEDLVIRLELAGVDRENIEITLHDNMLNVSGERESDLDERRKLLHPRALLRRFKRTMTLSSGVDEGSINAYSDNGMPKITVKEHRSQVTPHRDRGQASLARFGLRLSARSQAR